MFDSRVQEEVCTWKPTYVCGLDGTPYANDSTQHLWYQDDYGNTMLRLLSKKQSLETTESTPNNVFFLVEGFDATNKNDPIFYRDRAKIFFDTVTDTTNNTDAYILNFSKGGDDMYLSTAYVFHAIKWINDTHKPPKIIVAGMSMGGVLARMALMGEVYTFIDTRSTCRENAHDTCLTSNLSDVPVSHYVSLDSPHRKAMIDTKLMKFIPDPGKYFGGDFLTNWIIDWRSRSGVVLQQKSLKTTGGHQLLSNNPYYNDPDLPEFINPYWATLVDSSGNQIIPTIPDTTIAVSFANWDTLQINGPERWLVAVAASVGHIFDEVFFTMSKDND